jgi:type III secretory pathway lipoprotein EscJ
MANDLVEVISGAQADMTGSAVAVLREAGIEAVVRMAGERLASRMSGKDYLVDRVLVPAVDAERARELLAVRGFPSRAASADETSFEEEATGTGPGDESVREFLRRKD